MATNVQVTLSTARLKLVPLGPEHRDFTMKLDMDPDVMKHVAFGRPFTTEEAIQVHDWLLNSAKCVPGLGTWVGIANGEFVGWWILAAIPSKDDPKHFIANRTEYGFRVSPKFWGQGYAKEGAREIIRHAFQDLGQEEVIGETMTVNAASRAVMAGCGLKHVDTFFNKYDTPPPGIEEGEVRYSITKDEWLLLESGQQ
ncbi:GNAT family N-acetyltransferase [Aspergillus clavatus NRRL 1]|uniref:Acetyltransferase, GNAT family, putative n=1 Tax=Aspergillus clavatus (strain ATCC 1007 / CBS 513.65 / DSM 816 / NCTC 3887 / NRRL 1 / QM 1276 / 107) TaxID=344612 RepID=A1C4M5_ASPCL|nr:acetyltransferase, GNAT family, putative [Aspergillus clavatus NRRL 1]EAW15365.1 acetyltransferase, GNAT family, putative [Aspergillus clavatus NRRL 1]